MNNTQDLYNTNVSLLKKLNIPFKECTSEPVLSYETAEKVRNEHGLTGVESKSLFLRAKNGTYYMFISIEGNRADFDAIKELTGAKVSVASQEELKELTGCEPYCAIPFGYPEDIITIIDPAIYNHQRFIFSPGPTNKTIEIETKYIDSILEMLPNKQIKLSSV